MHQEFHNKEEESKIGFAFIYFLEPFLALGHNEHMHTTVYSSVKKAVL